MSGAVCHLAVAGRRTGLSFIAFGVFKGMKNHRKNTGRSSVKSKVKSISRRLLDYALMENPHLSLQTAARVWRAGATGSHGYHSDDL